MKDFSQIILAYALQNALEFGKANPGKVLPKLFQHGLDKADIQKIMPLITETVSNVNKIKPKEREEYFARLESLVKKHEEKEKDLPEIDVKGIKKVVTRMAPEPSKYPHLGHAMTFLLNYVYAQRYGGSCLLRFEDTNPEKVSQEFVDAILEGMEYLGIKPAKTRYVSDDMPLLYDHAHTLVKKGHAYVCFCTRERMQEFRHTAVECECRQFPPKIQELRWKELLAGKFAAGDAVLRLKGDMQHLNHVMRDPTLFRSLEASHYRHGTKYKLWPMYDFYNPIEDSLMGVTLILRSNEFDTRVALQDHLKELLGLKKQQIVQYGRFNVADFTTKGREIRELFESGELRGWDDPRLITLKALERRGITKEALYELIKQIGLSKHPVNLQFDMIAAINRKIIDPLAERYSFVADPVAITVKKAPALIPEVEVPLHPSRPEKRTIVVNEINISSEDYKTHKGKEIRLLHLYNIIVGSPSTYTSSEVKPIPKINWVADHVPARILMPDGTWKEGIAEKAVSKLKKGTLIQFERVGFVRYDRSTKGTYEFWFAHA